MNRAIEDCGARNVTDAAIEAILGSEGGSMKVNGEIVEGAVFQRPGPKLITAIVPVTEEDLAAILAGIVDGGMNQKVALEGPEGQAAAGIAQIPGGLGTTGVDHVREGAGLLPPPRHLLKQQLCIHQRGFRVG